MLVRVSLAVFALDEDDADADADGDGDGDVDGDGDGGGEFNHASLSVKNAWPTGTCFSSF